MAIRDGDWTLFDSDIKRGKYTWVKYEPDGSTTFRMDQHVDAILSRAAEQRSLSKKDWGGDWHHVASIPMSMLYGGEFSEAHKAGDMDYIANKLNDSDYSRLRTKEGRL